MPNVQFDTAENLGFCIRIFLEQSAGIVTITDIQMRSSEFTGNWFPGGHINVNGQQLLQMDYNSPATHVFRLNALNTWSKIQAFSNGTELPVQSKRLTGKEAKIEVQVTLFRDASSPQPVLAAEYTVKLATVRATAHENAKFVDIWPVVSNGGQYEKYRAIVHDGTGWKE